MTTYPKKPKKNAAGDDVLRADTGQDLNAACGEPILLQPKPLFRFAEIDRIDLKSDEFSNAAFLCGNSRISDPEKRIEHRFHTRDAVQSDAPFRQPHRECGRMWPFLRATLNCLVRNEPGISTTTQIASARMRQTSDIAFVLIRHTECKPIELNPTINC